MKPTSSVALAFAASGVLALLFGFGYDVEFAGIPYQDPTTQLEASYKFHSTVASRIELAGVCLLGASAAAMVLDYVWRWARKIRQR